MSTKYTDAIRARFNDPKGPDYQMAFVSNDSEEAIMQDLEDGECVTLMTLVVLIPSTIQNCVEDASGQPWKYAVAVNEYRELVD